MHFTSDERIIKNKKNKKISTNDLKAKWYSMSTPGKKKYIYKKYIYIQKSTLEIIIKRR